MPRASKKKAWPGQLRPGPAVPVDRLPRLIETACMDEPSVEQRQAFHAELSRISRAVPRDDNGQYVLGQFPTPGESLAALRDLQKAIAKIIDAVRELDMVTAGHLAIAGFDGNNAVGLAAAILGKAHGRDPTELIPDQETEKPELILASFEVLGGLLAQLQECTEAVAERLEPEKRPGEARPQSPVHLTRAAGQLADLFDRVAKLEPVEGQDQDWNEREWAQAQAEFVSLALEAMGLGKCPRSHVIEWIERWSDDAERVEADALIQWLDRMASSAWLLPTLARFGRPLGRRSGTEVASEPLDPR